MSEGPRVLLVAAILLAGCRSPELAPTCERLAPVAVAQPCTTVPPEGATEVGELEVPGYPYERRWLAEAAARGADLVEIRGGDGPMDLGPFHRGRLGLYRVYDRPPAPTLAPCPPVPPGELEARIASYRVVRAGLSSASDAHAFADGYAPLWGRELARRWYGGAWRAPDEPVEDGRYGPDGLLLLVPAVHGDVDPALFGRPSDAPTLCLRLELSEEAAWRTEGDERVRQAEVEWVAWDGQDGRLLLHRRTRVTVRESRYPIETLFPSKAPLVLATIDEVLRFLGHLPR